MDDIELASRVDEIERAIDQHPQTMAMLEEPLPYAIWYTLTAHQCLSNAQYAVINNQLTDGLMWSLRWIFGRCNSSSYFQTPVDVHPQRFRNARLLLKLGMNYHTFVTAIVHWRRKRAVVEFLDDSTLRFRRDSRELQYDVLDHLINIRNSNSINETNHEKMSGNSPVRKILSDIYLTSPYSSNSFFSIEYTPDQIFKIRESLSLFSKEMYKYPDSWSFRGIPITSFRKIWDMLYTISYTHQICHNWMLKETNKHVIPSLVIVKPYELWFDELKILLNDISHNDISTILQLLIYDHKLKKPDPALQPLIRINDNIALTPNLMIGRSHERNLMSLLSKNWDVEYSKTTRSLEETLKDEWENISLPYNFHIVTKRKIPFDESLPDVDVAIYNPSSTQLLIIELKWVIAPAETFEILQRCDSESKGITQIRKLLNYCRKDLNKFWSVLFPDIALPDSLQVNGCVAMRGFVGTASNWNSEIPVIEESILKNILINTENLAKAVKSLLCRNWLPVEGKDFTEIETKVEIGDYNIIWHGAKIDLESSLIRQPVRHY